MNLKFLYPVSALLLAGSLSWVILRAPAGIYRAQLEQGNLTRQTLAAQLRPLNTALSGSLPDHSDGLLFQTSRLLRRLNTTVQVISSTANVVRQASVEERAELRDVNGKTSEAMSGLVTATQGAADIIADMRHTTLPGLDQTIEGLTVLENAVTQPAVDALSHGGEALNLTAQDLGRIGVILNDPAITATASSLASMSANLNSAAAHADKTLGYIQLDFTPTRLPFWRSVLSTALSQAIGIPLHYLPQAVTVVSSATTAK